MNQFDVNNCPVPFSIIGTYSTEDEKDPNFGKILKLDHVILLRNQQFLSGELMPRTNQEMIFDRNWMLFDVETKAKKSVSHWHLCYLNLMEII